MTKDEYNKELELLREKHRKEVSKLNILYATSNNHYKVGDVFRDHIGMVRIKQICVGMSLSGYPECYFIGTEIKLNGSPKKRNIERSACLCNEYKKG